MKRAYIFVLAVFAFTPRVFAQDGAPIIKSEVMSAFVWGQDSPSGAISSTMQDPLTGNAIHALSYNGIEVSSRMGFERAGADEVGIFLSYTATIVNGTDSKLLCGTVEYVLTGARHHLFGLCLWTRSSVSRNARASQTRWSLKKSIASRAVFFRATISFRQTPHLKCLRSPPSPR
jgi:hypothetical protein